MFGKFDDETGGHGGDLLRALEKWSPPGGDLLDFSSNVNPLGPPPGLLDYLKGILPEIVNYPSPQSRELRQKLAAFLCVPENRVVLGNGANELIHLLLLWHRPRRVLVPAPSFSEYERAAVLARAEVERFYLLPEQDLKRLVPLDTINAGDLVVFCNPNNPTGKLYPRRELVSLIEEILKRGAKALIDESFIPLTGRMDESLRDLTGKGLWVVLSLTKLWGLPGLRLGCAIGPAKEACTITRWGDPWRVNILAQKAGLYCLEDKKHLRDTLELVKKERRYLDRRFRETGRFQAYESAANFLLLRGTDPGFDASAFQADLAGRGILVRRADNFYGLDRSHFRIAVRRRPENLRLLKAVEQWLKKGGKPPAGTGSGGDGR